MYLTNFLGKRMDHVCKRSQVVAAIFMLCLACCCVGLGEARYFSNETKCIQHFQSNKRLFEQAVERWQGVSGANAFEFHRWDDNALVWNDTEIKPTKDGYDVIRSGRVLAERIDFDHASASAGISADELRWWMNVSQTLQLYWISNIGTKLPSDQRYIEVSLRGSERGPYGFIYVPEGHTAAYETFLYEAERNQPPLTYTKLDHVEGRWFYFEGKV
jgi:hypothetical protein